MTLLGQVFMRIALALNMLLLRYPAWALRGFEAGLWPVEKAVIELVAGLSLPDFRTAFLANVAEADSIQRAIFKTTDVGFYKFAFLRYSQQRRERFPENYEGTALTLDIDVDGTLTWVEIQVFQRILYSLRFGTDMRPLKNCTVVTCVKAKGRALLPPGR